MNATINSNNWYFNGEGKSEYGTNPIEDLDPAEQVEAEVFVEKFKKDAPAGFVFSEPSEEQPFGSWTRETDKFGGTTVVLGIAQGTEWMPQEAYPDNFEMWIYVGEGLELASIPAGWDKVDSEIQSYLDHWAKIDGTES